MIHTYHTFTFVFGFSQQSIAVGEFVASFDTAQVAADRYGARVRPLSMSPLGKRLSSAGMALQARHRFEDVADLVPPYFSSTYNYGGGDRMVSIGNPTVV